jgi:hypothetical protein
MKLSAIPLCSVLLLAPRLVLAQRPPAAPAADPQDTARAMGREGIRLYNAGKWADAYEQFRRADLLYHAPTLVLYMANCQKALGKLVEARALYRRLADEPLPPSAPDQFRTAQATAREGLDDLKRRIPSLRVSLSGPAAAGAHVRVDGAPVAAAEIGQKDLDPGEHTVEASADGVPAVARTVHLQEGASVLVDLTLGGDVGPLAAAPPLLPPPKPDVPEGKPRGSLVPAGIAFGIGAVGLGVGLATGLASMSKTSDLKSRCQGDLCPAADQGEASSARGLGNASTVGFVVAGAGLATGVVMLVLRSGGAKKEGGAGVRAQVGLGSVRFVGEL